MLSQFTNAGPNVSKATIEYYQLTIKDKFLQPPRIQLDTFKNICAHTGINIIKIF